MFYVLGANGFIGSYVAESLRKTESNLVTALKKNNFDITHSSDYLKFNFNEATIIDCITKIDGYSEDVMETNYYSFKNFIDYLNNSGISYRYIYFSTMTSNDKKQVKSNPYVRSKHLAERYIIENVINYTIIRLAFPFGKGEGGNRLISRIINKILNNEDLILDDVTLNLTSIDFLIKYIPELIKSKKKIIKFTDGIPYRLSDVVDVICRALSKPNRYKVNPTPIDLTVTKTKLFYNNTSALHDIEKFASEIKR